ncbi:cytochrome P450 [Raphidocelis subcapitata]|uniref:Cytochrome P450 n=1 Tax=Raphidocelis subcapitata TaxID=307507 RepID=A0A2V0PEG3_9CHLO|nr:cytochrome P450 [Raphidocelis subcapitata]|eukprot:GBF95475.1 cytochrome P450 [Raphidocelis subcapitata]
MALSLRASSALLLGARGHALARRGTAAAARPAAAPQRPLITTRAYRDEKGRGEEPKSPPGGKKEPLPASLPHEGGAPQDSLLAFPFARPAAAEPPVEFGQLLASGCPLRAKLFDGTPVWLLAKMKDVKAALVDPRLSKVRTHPGFPELSAGAKAAISDREPTFVDLNPPEHTRLRAMFAAPFERAAVDALRPFIRETVEGLIAGIERKRAYGGHKGPFDLHEEFSLPLAFAVIHRILGIHPEEGRHLSKNVAVRASGSSTARDAAAAQEEIVEFMSRHAAAKEADPSGDDVISSVVRNHLTKGDITRDQLVAHAFLLLVAGNATVASMIDLGVVELLGRPDQLQALRDDPSLLRAAAEEACRFHTASAYALRRVAVEDFELSGAHIKAGEGVIALNQAANRDREAFEDPSVFNIFRNPPPPNVAYGYGTHECIARELSLAELEAAYGGLFSRLPGLRLGVERSELPWSDPRRDVGLAALPVVWW